MVHVSERTDRAYEWAFGDVNPRVGRVGGLKDRARRQRWRRRQGGFLGLDNIGVFERSAPLPTGGYINQADATAWMAMYRST